MSTTQENKTIKIGDTVNWSESWGRKPVVPTKVVSIELCKSKREKHGKDVVEVPVDKKDYCVFILDNGHWAYGEQIEVI